MDIKFENEIVPGANDTFTLVAGALRLSGTATDTFTTPEGAAVTTKLNIPLMQLGNYSQVVMVGIPANSSSSARVLSIIDARTGVHNPSLAVFCPNENDSIGLSWDGSNSVAYLKTTSAMIGLRVNGTDLAAFQLDGSTKKIGFFGSAPVAKPSGYTISNVAADRTFDANSTTLDEVADVLGTLIADLKALGLIG